MELGPSACPGTSEDWPRGAGQGGQGEGSQVFFRSSEGVTQFNQQILMLGIFVSIDQEEVGVAERVCIW